MRTKCFEFSDLIAHKHSATFTLDEAGKPVYCHYWFITNDGDDKVYKDVTDLRQLAKAYKRLTRTYK